MKHILLNDAQALTPRLTVLPPDDFMYDLLKGYWESSNGTLLMDDERFPSVGSKKFDVETGEDKKGR